MINAVSFLMGSSSPVKRLSLINTRKTSFHSLPSSSVHRCEMGIKSETNHFVLDCLQTCSSRVPLSLGPELIINRSLSAYSENVNLIFAIRKSVTYSNTGFWCMLAT